MNRILLKELISVTSYMQTVLATRWLKLAHIDRLFKSTMLGETSFKKKLQLSK